MLHLAALLVLCVIALGVFLYTGHRRYVESFQQSPVICTNGKCANLEKAISADMSFTSLRVNRDDKDTYPRGWGKGLHSRNVYANGTIGAGKNGSITSYINSDGNAYMSGKVHTNKLQLGNKFILSGNGDAHSNDGWLRMLDRNGKDFYGGFATGSLWTPGFHSNGSSNNFKGGVSTHNPYRLGTHLPWGDGKNYIRGDTEIRGNTNNLGNLNVDGNMRTRGELRTHGPKYGDKTWFRHNEPNNPSGHKIAIGAGEATIIGGGESAGEIFSKEKHNDKEDLVLSTDNRIRFVTNLQNGYGARIEAADFQANGMMNFRKPVTFHGNDVRFKGGKSVHNPYNWQTHFPSPNDNKNYIRGDTEIRGNTNNIGDLRVGTKFCIKSTCITDTQLAKLK